LACQAFRFVTFGRDGFFWFPTSSFLRVVNLLKWTRWQSGPLRYIQRAWN
jgi:hypothetical protein